MELQKAKIIKALSMEGIPKHIDMWMREVQYYRDDIITGESAVLFYDENTKMIVISHVQNIREDENNLVLTTEENCVYYIKKFL